MKKSLLILSVILSSLFFMGCPPVIPDPEPTQILDPEPDWSRSDKMVFVQFFGQSALGTDNPTGICQDADGNIYVAGYPSGTVYRFKSDLTYDKSYAGLNCLFDVAIDSHGRLVALDAANNMVRYVNVDDGSITSSFSASAATANLIYGFGLDKNDNVYLGCYWDDKVVKFAPDGTMLMIIAGISCPRDVAINQSGVIFAIDYKNSRILKYDAAGKFIGQFGSAGTDDGQFANPLGIAVDKYGKIYIADGPRLQKMETDGTFICKIDRDGSGNPLFSLAWRITLNNEGIIYATDMDDGRIVKITQE